jgi:hypothetical protein
MRIRTLATLAASTSMLLAPFASAAGASVEISHFDTTTPVDETFPADCFAGDQHVVGTERIAGQVVQHPDGRFNLRGTLTDDLSVEFSNGWTGDWTTKEQFALSGNSDGSQGVTNNVHVDTTQVFDENGTPVGEVTFRVVERFTVANGTVHADFAHARLTCDF